MRQRSSRLALGLVLVLGGSISCATPGAAPETSVPRDPFDLPRPEPGRLPSVGTPELYELSIRADPRQELFAGEARIHLRIEVPTRALPFHAGDMRIDEMWVETAGGRRIKGEVARIPQGEAIDPTERVALLDESIEPGAAMLFIRYTAPFAAARGGLVRLQEFGPVYVLGGPTGARDVFPCIDEPDAKAPFLLRLTVPNGFVAVANTPLAERTSDDGYSQLRFEPTPPISPHLFAFAIGDLRIVSGPRRPTQIRAITVGEEDREAGLASELHAELLGLLEGWLGMPYPFAGLDILALPGLPGIAYESPGLIFYRDDLLLGAETEINAEHTNQALLYAHELSHMWVGNLVTMAWWNDLWLTEAMATLLGERVFGLLFPELAQRAPLVDWRAKAFERDASARVRTVRSPVTTPARARAAFDAITYYKGALILGMIEQWLGPEEFRAGVQSFVRAHAWKSATSSDLVAALEEASGERRLGPVVESFTRNQGMPMIRAACEEGESGVEFVLEQSRYLPLGSAADGAHEALWTIPVCLSYPTRDDGVAFACHLLDEPALRSTIEDLEGCPAWIHPNSGEHGYYRWATSPEQLPKLAAALTRPWGEEHPAGFDPAKRGLLVLADNLFAMVAAGELDPGSFLSLIETVVSGDDPRVLEGTLGALHRLVDIFEELTESEGFAVWLQRVLEPHAMEMGWDPRAGEDPSTSRARDDLLWLLSLTGRPWVIEGAGERARSWLDEPLSAEGLVSPTIVAIASSSGTLEHENLRALLSRETSKRTRSLAIEALAHLPPGEELAGALPVLLDPSLTADEDVRAFLFTCMKRPAARDQTFDFVTQNFDALARRAENAERRGSLRLSEMVGFFRDERARDQARSFFEGLGDDAFLGPSRLGEERSEQAMAIRRYGAQALETYLAEQPRPAPRRGAPRS